MAITFPGTPTTYASAASSSAVLSKPGSVQDGDHLFAFIRNNSSTSATDWACSGWARVDSSYAASNAAGRSMGIYYKHIPVAASESATDYTFTNPVSGRVSAVMCIIRGVHQTTPIQVTDSNYNSVSVTNGTQVRAMTATGQGVRIFAFGNEVVSPNAAPLVTKASEITLIAEVQSVSGTSVTRTTMSAGYEMVSGAGSYGTRAVTWNSVSASNGNQVILNVAANVAPVANYTQVQTYRSVAFTDTSTDSDGTITGHDWDYGDGTTHGTTTNPTHVYAAGGVYTVVLTVTDNGGATHTKTKTLYVAAYPWDGVSVMVAGVETAASSIATMVAGVETPIQQALEVTPGFTVSDLIGTSNFQVAHRGLGGQYPEEAMIGYDAAARLGFMAMEVSLHRTSDGVFVASHDDDPDRVFGTTGGTVWSSRTWSSVSGFTSAAGPILRLEQILDKYAASRVLFLDDKTNGATVGAYGNATDALLALIGAHATTNGYTATDHFVYKGFKGWTPAATKWTDLGYEAWGIFYPGEPAVYSDRFPYFTMLGMQYDGTGDDWSLLAATGKPIIAHVISSDSQRTAAVTNSGGVVDGFMTTNAVALP